MAMMSLTCAAPSRPATRAIRSLPKVVEGPRTWVKGPDSPTSCGASTAASACWLAGLSTASTPLTPARRAACAATAAASTAHTATLISAPATPRAQVTHLAVLTLSFAPSCSATIRTFQLTAAPSSSAPRRARPRPSPDAFLSLRRGLEAHELQLLAPLDAERGERDGVERLFLRLHDVRQLHITGLVQAQVRGDDRRQVDFQRLESGIDFARHARARGSELELRGIGRLGAIPQRREHLSGLAVVIVDRLLAEDHEQRLLAFDELQQRPRRNQRLDHAVGLHQHGAIRPHGQRRAQLRLAVRRAHGGDDHLLGATVRSEEHTSELQSHGTIS